MKTIIITNNKDIKEIAPEWMELKHIDDSLEKVIEAAETLIGQGYRLAADPLAGYNFYGNPYHTFFLGESEGLTVKASEITRLEKVLNSFKNPRKNLEMDEHFLAGLRALDCSIAETVVKGIISHNRYINGNKIENKQ